MQENSKFLAKNRYVWISIEFSRHRITEIVYVRSWTVSALQYYTYITQFVADSRKKFLQLGKNAKFQISRGTLSAYSDSFGANM